MPASKKTVLIADPSIDLLQSIKNAPRASDYEIITTTSGSECLDLLKSSSPDLLIVDLMLPEAHGIEILKEAKKLHDTKVIMTAFHPMIQNCHSAMKLGASYFLEKPFSQEDLFPVIEKLFHGTLKPNFSNNKQTSSHKIPAHPPSHSYSSYLKFWGTRGSNPVAGPEYIRFGGNTPSLEVRCKDDLVIIDAGSGIRSLGQLLHDHPAKEINILLSHTHWDHLLGFPFFFPIYQHNRKIVIWSPVGFEQPTKKLFSNMLDYSYFPVGLDDMQSTVCFKDLRDHQTIDFGTIRIHTHYAYHPGATLCFIIEIKGQKIGYITDNEFLMGCTLPYDQIQQNSALFAPYESLISFLKGCDLLICESQYTDEEYLDRIGWGHSSITNGAFLLKETGIKKWVVTHHDPTHTDEALLRKKEKQIELLKKIFPECSLDFAYDGMVIHFD